ncbi:hypothetical protein [Leucothrix arctica]|uniref:Acetyl-CoA acetyltransferase n=1 Tax=Leucothrix arctica TaxID=1481894 RepID=A0A317CDX9_9GAMM|nr:hypothetical protein [Leucothrix arctica]PWQ95533.1 hypothetical protein DKT75_12175 [Leucothrix arctica]
MPLPPQQPVYLVDGTRTPFDRRLRRDSSGGNAYTAQDLLHIAARDLLSRQPFDSTKIDNVIMASSQTLDCSSLAEDAARRLRCTNALTPQTFSGNEGVGIQALSYAYQAITSQGKSLVLLGGVEVVNAPLISASDELSEWFQVWKNASSISAKTKVFNTLHTSYFRQRAMPSDTPNERYTRHQSQAEAAANQSQISLDAQAEYVNLSQRRLKYAQRNNTLCNIVPVYYLDGSSRSSDENVITLDPESLKQALQTNPEATGLVTQNSVAQATEGACCLLLASQAFIDEYNITPLAQLFSPNTSACTDAIEASLNKHDLTSEEIDYWEWDEASAAEILALKQKPLFKSLSSFDRINLDGGCLATGNPFAAGQLRNILQLSHTLQRNKGEYGVCHFGFNSQNISTILLRNAIGDTAGRDT